MFNVWSIASLTSSCHGPCPVHAGRQSQKSHRQFVTIYTLFISKTRHKFTSIAKKYCKKIINKFCHGNGQALFPTLLGDRGWPVTPPVTVMKCKTPPNCGASTDFLKDFYWAGFLAIQFYASFFSSKNIKERTAKPRKKTYFVIERKEKYCVHLCILSL